MKVHELQHQIFIDKVSQQKQSQRLQKANQPAFDAVLKKKMATSAASVKFSQHAVERLASRDISLTKRDLGKLNDAVQTIAEKGGKDSLLLMRDLAFVVSVENRTVVTVLGKNQTGNDRVFTNIDSALII